MQANRAVTGRPDSITTLETATLAGALFWLFLLYGHSLHSATPEPMRAWWSVLGPLNLTRDFLNPVYWSPGAFVASYVCGLGAIGWMLTRRRGWRAAAIICGIGLPISLQAGQLAIRPASR
jgi:hypothetical protein